MNHPGNRLSSRQLLLALTPFALILALVAGCGSDDTDDPPSATEHNGADVAFASDMIQHHAQALSMVNLTVDREVSAEFKALATRIRDAQAPEIETMADWLEEWDEEIPETENDHMNHDMGTMPEGTEDMPGMMSAEEMDQLDGAPDDQFETMWWEMMILHHEGAIEMAEDEVDDGRYAPAIELARSIISSQRAEIEEMKDLIAGR